MSRDELRIGVVGMGKMGLVHSCVLNVIPGVKIVALCEKSRLTRKVIGRMFSKAQIVDDVEKFVHLDLDAVYITTPIPSHFPVANSVYTIGISQNLFVEKTLAKSAFEARELCKSAQNHGGVNMVGYLRRYYVTFKKAKELLAQNVIGEPLSFKAYAYSSDFLDIQQSTAPILRGGVLRDMGCHAVDLAIWFFGDLSVSSAHIQSIVTDSSEDSVGFTVKNSGGIEGEFNVSWCMENYRMPEVGFKITGRQGTIEVNDDEVRLETQRDGQSRWYRHDLGDHVDFWLALPEYYREDLCFVNSIREKRPSQPDFCAASKVDETLENVGEKAERS